jgi:hypothetical protein
MNKKKFIDKDGVIAKLKKMQGNQRAYEFAAMLGISGSYLSDIYSGKEAPGFKVLEKLGLRRVFVYEEVA